MPTYKLTYFDGKGRAETIRLVLAASGTKFEDIRITFAQWPEMKSTAPFGGLPMLEFKGKKLGQSNSICRMLAREHGLSGKSNWERAEVESIADVITDIREKSINAFIEKDEQKKADLMKENQEKIIPGLLDLVEKFLTENKGGNGWLVGTKMTWADLHLFACTEDLRTASPELFKGYPKLDALVDRVAKQGRVAEYLKKRPVGAF